VRAVDLACDFGVASLILTFEAQVACGQHDLSVTRASPTVRRYQTQKAAPSGAAFYECLPLRVSCAAGAA
jgi:hypothetical protein